MSRRAAARILAAVLALGVIALGAIAFIGISVDAGRWREPVAAALSRALDREVRLDGSARLTLSLRPEFLVRDLRIANPPGFQVADFARIGELRVAMALLPLLRDEVRLTELRGRDVAVRLARGADGRGNWSLGDRAGDGPAGRSRVGVDRIALENVTIEYAGTGAGRRLDLAEFTVEAPPGQPTLVAARGRSDAFVARATGGPLSGLGGAEPWPFHIQVFSAAAALNANGSVSGPLDRAAVRAMFGAGTPDLRALAQGVGADSPAGAAAIAGELEAGPGRAALTSINAVIGSLPLAGELALETGGPRPRISGRLAVPALELPTFRAAGGGAGPADTLAAAFGELERTDIDLGRLLAADAELRLSVAHLGRLPGDVRDVAVHLRIEAGRLAAPIVATIGGARFTGELAADGAAAPPRLRAQLAARDAPLGGLAELLFDVPHVAGHVRRFAVALDGSGRRVGELARDLEARITIDGADFTYGNHAGGRPVAMRLDLAEAAQPRGRTIAGKLRGSLRGKPFSATFRAGTVERILRDRRTPFDFDGASGGVRVRLAGSLAEPDDRAGPAIAFDVTAPHARELAPWLGLSSASDARVALKGRIELRRREGSLAGATFVLGGTSVAGNAGWRASGGKTLVQADLVAEVLAPAELRALAPPSPGRRATVLDLPILPEPLDLADYDAQVRVKRIDGLPLAITDVTLAARMRDGEIPPSPFALRVEGSALTGAVALDARRESPNAAVWLAGDDVDAGLLLRRLRVARDIDARIGTLRLYADIRERRLGDALEQSAAVVSIESGTLALGGAFPRIAVAHGELRAAPGTPLTAAIAGTAGTLPIKLQAQGGVLRELFEPGARLPFSLTAETPAARLEMSGSAAPQRDPAVALSIALTGKRLDALDELLEASLPPWGPYALTGRLRFSRQGYEVDAMRLAIGGSVLEGKGSLDTSRTLPRFDVALTAGQIRLDDFPLGDWSPFEPRTGSPLTVETARQTVREGALRVHAIFSRELMARAEGSAALTVKRLMSGNDELGSGRVRARVERGRATIGPVEIDSRAGTARGSFAYEPRERDVVVDAAVKIDRFDYGTLARMLRPGGTVDGAISIDLRLAATAPRLSAALATGSGRFDFAAWPERVRGGAFDFWTVNLLFRLLPFVDAGASLVNCVVGEFDLEHGTLRSRRLIIDTANTRTGGSGTADFATDALHLRFVPRAKVPQFFSLATPVEAVGTFDDYRFTVRRIDALGTAARWAASPVVVPIQRLVGERVPADGRDVCTNPGR